MYSVGLIVLIILILWRVHGSHGDCDPNIPSRPVPVPPSFVVDVDGIQSIICCEGEYLDWFECKPCEDGTFMTPKMAQEGIHLYCEKCYETKMYEIVTVPCTKTRDSTIMCEDGYYRSDVQGKPCQSECRRCDVCGLGINMFKNHEVIPCGGYDNTVCSNGVYTSVMNFENVSIAPSTSILILDSDVEENDDSGRTISYSNNKTRPAYTVNFLNLVLSIVLIIKILNVF
ncbi:unnamed protein product [Lymnaea stagnalis]|uniref:TNFR-Cys domain-containing protein n=1 Tax=Lymnaea stagnalis TaxID=6523 RepID=A0AAV2HSZ5_LYMST